MCCVVAVPEIANTNYHGVARVTSRSAKERDFALGIGQAHESLAVRAYGGTDIIPTAVKHHVVCALAENVRRLQAPCLLAKLRIGAHRNAHRFPIRISQPRAFPTIKEPRVAALFRVTNAGPELPRAVRPLPHAEINRLLLGVGQFAQIRIARDLPPVTDNPRFFRRIRSAGRGGREAEYSELV